MKRVVSVSAVIMLAVCMIQRAVCEVPEVKENLLQAFPDDPLGGWDVAHGDVKASLPRPDGEASESGGKSLHFSNNAKAYSKTLIKVEPGYEYHISVWGKYKNLKYVKSGAYGVGFGLEQQNSDKIITGNWYPMACYLKYGEGKTDWVQAEYSWRPNETTAYMRPFLLVWADPGSDVWFDEVKVWKTPIPEVKVERWKNIVENGSFEVRYESVEGSVPNGFDVSAPAGKGDSYRKNRVCVEDIRSQGRASMRFIGESAVTSVPAFLETEKAVAQISVKTEGDGANAYANLVFYDKDRKRIEKKKFVEQSGTQDWKVYKESLDKIDPRVKYVQWEIGKAPGEGTVWIDDLQVNAPSTMERLPDMAKDTARGTVDVDCAIQEETFESPLNSVDAGSIHYLYSPTVHTAGKFVEGPGRWIEERKRLGFKYLRIHHIFQTNVWEIEDKNGKWVVNQGASRTHWPESDEAFPPIWTKDKDGVIHYDFSCIKHVLDKAVLPGGCKPIIGLEPVPRDMAVNGNPQLLPNDFKEWEELNYQFVKFLVDTYGKEEVKTWIFETGNEPGTEPEFHGTADRSNIEGDFIKLQDFVIAGAMRALPEIFIAGPSGAPVGMVEPILDHCATGVNYATGEVGTKIDAVSYHGYQSGSASDISWRPIEDMILNIQGSINRFYQKTGRQLPLFNTEFSPIYHDGNCDLKHLCDADNHIQAIATMHAGYFSHKHDVKMLTFFTMHPTSGAFYNGVSPSDIPEFSGHSAAITLHGIFTPVCRTFEMMSMLNGGTEVSAVSKTEPIRALASKTDKEIKVLCYSFDVNPKANYTTKVDVRIKPDEIGKKFKVTKYEMSGTKANSAYLAKQMKLTQADCENDVSLVDKINRESELKPEDLGEVEVKDGVAQLSVDMPAYSASLLVLEKVE